ncbi:MAG TPA: DUF72 domain-containing protein [Acidobacteriota bacterium]|nr:DUF72 domain-containing protein [Acidobacteriota bacterium]
MIYVGTSGFAYKEWKGSFYPEDLPQKDYLRYYASQLSTTEINNTFYRSPSAKTVAQWKDKVPDSFRFTLKMNRRVTHHRRLKDVEENLEWFQTGAAPLEEQLGCVLVQLPPYFKCDLERLKAFLDVSAEIFPMAFEFRHDSWFCDDTYCLLEDANQTLAVVEADDREAVRVLTGPLVYVRLRSSGYESGQLEEWADWLGKLDRDALVYFKHEGQAPTLALELAELLKE